jgi:hypothetical protein
MMFLPMYLKIVKNISSVTAAEKYTGPEPTFATHDSF